MSNYDMISTCTDAVKRGFMDKPKFNRFNQKDDILKYCLLNKITDHYQLYEHDTEMYYDFLCTESSGRSDDFNPDVTYIIFKLSQIHHADNTDYAIEDLVTALNSEIAKSYDPYIDQAINVAWESPHLYLDGEELQVFQRNRGVM